MIFRYTLKSSFRVPKDNGSWFVYKDSSASFDTDDEIVAVNRINDWLSGYVGTRVPVLRMSYADIERLSQKSPVWSVSRVTLQEDSKIRARIQAETAKRDLERRARLRDKKRFARPNDSADTIVDAVIKKLRI